MSEQPTKKVKKVDIEFIQYKKQFYAHIEIRDITGLQKLMEDKGSLKKLITDDNDQYYQDMFIKLAAQSLFSIAKQLVNLGLKMTELVLHIALRDYKYDDRLRNTAQAEFLGETIQHVLEKTNIQFEADSLELLIHCDPSHKDVFYPIIAKYTDRFQPVRWLYEVWTHLTQMPMLVDTLNIELLMAYVHLTRFHDIIPQCIHVFEWLAAQLPKLNQDQMSKFYNETKNMVLEYTNIHPFPEWCLFLLEHARPDENQANIEKWSRYSKRRTLPLPLSFRTEPTRRTVFRLMQLGGEGRNTFNLHPLVMDTLIQYL
jgi:hypothetical protein